MSSVLESLNSALHRAFADDKDVYLLGEDILDPYGGAFKVTRGLSTSFPERVLTTPISEGGFVGVAAGMAMRGMRPVVEIMFGDFITLAADQLVNHIAKFRWMYNDQVRVPIVIRTPMGGRRGYGPTHSQTLEKLLMGVPGLQVVTPAALCLSDGTGGPGALLYHSILYNDDPVVFIENKLQYLLPVQSQAELDEFDLSPHPSSTVVEYPTYVLSLRGAPPATITLAAYGYMAEMTKLATIRLAYEHEIFSELVIPTRLSPFEIEPIIASTSRTGCLLVVEEGTLTLGWGAEVVAQVAEALGTQSIKVKRLAAKDLPVPSSGPLEALVLPDLEQIIEAATHLK
ncbi:MAG: hypothetical protein A2Y88_06550 [Chloroflexi bacterium RBG_13_48_10]|nr:MAG: hypothetical protein A2Y88_06550 [Chloroflexi bacterium RBG_13_48_10]